MSTLTDLMSDINYEELIALVKNQLENRDPLEILDDLKNGLEKVGDFFEKGEYYLADLIFAADIFKEVNALLEPKIAKSVDKIKGKIVIGTVHGDFHDIGKNITISLLKSNGFEVIDLGVDVSPEKFLETVQKEKPEFLGMSGLLTAAFEPMKKTIELIRKEYKNKIIIIVGGAMGSKDWISKLDADFGTDNAAVGIKIINEAIKNI